MANIVNRTTKQLLQSVNTPDYSEEDWIVNPDLSALASVPVKYWKIDGDSVVEMTTEEKSVVDAANAPQAAIDAVSSIINDAKTFGQKLIDDTAILNVLSGITQAGKTEALINYCHRLTHCLMTGSLYAALTELDTLIADESQTKIDLSPFITNTLLNEAKTKILVYLGLA